MGSAKNEGGMPHYLYTHSRLQAVQRRTSSRSLHSSRGLAREIELEAETQDKEGTAEEQLLKSFSAVHLKYPFVAYAANKKRNDKNLPRPFAEACKNPLSCNAMNRESNALVRRGT